ARGNPARGLEARHPAHRAGDAHPETLGRRIARHAAVHHCPHNALAKIVGKRHPRRLLRAAKIMNQNSSDSGIPQRFTSLGYRSKGTGPSYVIRSSRAHKPAPCRRRSWNCKIAFAAHHKVRPFEKKVGRNAMTDPITENLLHDIGRARGTDYFLMKEQLMPEEAKILKDVREFGEEHVLPIVNSYWERGEFPFELIPKIAAMNIVGDHNMREHGSRAMTAVGAGLVMMELSRIDTSVATFFAVHLGLAMQSINLLGSEEQKRRYLPAMARLEKIGAFALTEPDHGSDSVGLETTARREGNEWVINGRKRWPGNAVWCDYIIVYARDVADKQVKAFVVEKDNPGYKATKILGKMSLRITQNADIILSDCRVS